MTRKYGGTGLGLAISSEKKKILLVEDNKMNRFVFEAFLKKRGLDFDVAENGEDLCRVLERWLK